MSILKQQQLRSNNNKTNNNLNRTWTLLPDNDEDGAQEDEEEDEEEERNPNGIIDLENHKELMLDDDSTNIDELNNFRNDFQMANNNHCNSNKNRRSLVLNAEILKNILSPSNTPFLLMKSLNIDLERVSIELDNLKTRFDFSNENTNKNNKNNNEERFESLFDERIDFV
jgi:hypothetical protein